MSRSARLRAKLVVVACLVPAAAGAEVMAAQNGVVIERRGPSGPWTLSNGTVTLTVGFDAGRVLGVMALTLADTGASFADAGREGPLEIDGRALSVADSPTVGMRLVGTAAEGEGQGLRLDLVFASSAPAARITRSYACHPSVDVLETWTTVAPAAAGPLAVGAPVIFSLRSKAREISWIRGLQAPEESLGSFTLERLPVETDQAITIEASGRSTETALPWFVSTSDPGSLFGGLMWSGRWALTLSGRSSGATVSFSLPATTVSATADQPFVSPRGFFGAVSGGPAAVAAAMRRFLVDVVREGRNFEPLVTYNTWFSYGTRMDAGVVTGEIEMAARLGAELFQLDAGWYEGSNVDDAFDFSTGLGAWYADPARFPLGIRPLADLAHQRGMRFGLWVEPERVDLSTLGRPGAVEESWLATRGGHYVADVANEEARTGQLCLAHPAARQWVVDQLTRLVDEYGLDYIKWDNNAWLLCDRPGHGHGPTGGDVAHVNALYSILSELRSRYPALLIENCSGGGNRIDLGLARYTDVAWMDDRTSPSRRVRHNLQGLSAMLPPAYLLSFAISGADGLLQRAEDVPLLARSRMPGILGLTYRSSELGTKAMAAIRQEIAGYKRVREVLRNASAVLLSPQVSEASPPEWDASLAVTAAGDAVLFAFQNDGTAERAAVFPTLLRPDMEYEIVSMEGEILGRASGAAVMASGIELDGRDGGARVLLLAPREE